MLGEGSRAGAGDRCQSDVIKFIGGVGGLVIVTVAEVGVNGCKTRASSISVATEAELSFAAGVSRMVSWWAQKSARILPAMEAHCQANL